MRLLPFGAAALLAISPAMAFDCSPLKPQPAKDTAQTFTGKLDASVDGLFAKLASVGTKVEGTYSEIEKNVLMQFPGANKLYMWERVLFLQCGLLNEAKDMSSKEKLQQVGELYQKFDSPPPASQSLTNTGNNSQINQGIGNSITTTK
ncbi:hypothetical protein [Bradyrhizobium erythrophlei]|jgi:hypothetical protein|uniref:Uncharacterized protein n=1 Tax=Bradyrhizobium erythrophlei TaxID=1437360 RepID=A0A1M5R9B9_9BRAD|nr:hypothetical protein [Bradyrhizobium erythrophlei]SHH22942.1 hypothetical protein SAMN05444169_6430 [Bradyrhizobium erythrophlei]